MKKEKEIKPENNQTENEEAPTTEEIVVEESNDIPEYDEATVCENTYH